MHRVKRYRTLAVALIVAGLWSACAESPTEPITVSTVQVSPGNVTIASGASTTLSAQARTSKGTPIEGRVAIWSSADAQVATVGASGTVTAGMILSGAPRSTNITALVDGVAGVSTVTVTPVPVATVLLAPDSVTLAPGGSVLLEAALKSAEGQALTGRAIVWTSLASDIATVSEAGFVTARPFGGGSQRVTRIVATSEGRADTAVVVVTPLMAARVVVTPDSVALVAGASTTLAARVEDAVGTLLTGRVLTWVSSDTAVVTVSAAGVVSARTYTDPGSRTARVVASSEGRADTAVVVVTPLVAARVIVTPDSVAVATGASTTLTARVEDAAGTVLTGRVFVWSSADTAIATVTPAGVVTARVYTGAELRLARIIVASEGRADTAAVVVSPLTAARVVLTPDSVALVPGSSTTLAARVEDIAGTTLTGRVVAWSSLDTVIVTVSGTGVVTARAFTDPGLRTSRVVATSEGRADTAVMVVTPLTAARVVVTPDTVSVVTGASTSLNARVESAGGTTLTGRAVIWSSADTTIATVSPTGIVAARVYLGADSRTVRIVATSEGVADTAAVRVTPAPVARVVVTPDALTLTPRDTATGTVAVLDGANRVLSGRSISWISSDTAVASVSSSGKVTASPYSGASARIALVVAASEGRSDSITVTVNPSPVATVSVAPDSLQLTPGVVGNLVLSVRDAIGGALVGRSAVWTVADTAIASVSTAGVVTAKPYAGASSRRTVAIVVVSSVADTTPIIVAPATAARVVAGPDSTLLAIGETKQLSASVLDAAGGVLVDRPVVWTATDTAVASVSAAGVVTAKSYSGIAIRSTRVIASAAGTADTVRVFVTPAQVYQIAIDPDSVELDGGDTLRFVATLRDSAGNPLVGRRVQWGSTNADLFEPDSTGLVIPSRALDFTDSAVVLAIVDSPDAVCTYERFGLCLSVGARVRVRPLAIGSINIGIDTLFLRSGEVVAVSPVVLDVNGQPSQRPARWVTSMGSSAFIECDDGFQVLGAACTRIGAADYPEPETRSDNVYLVAGGDATVGTPPLSDSVRVVVRPWPVASVSAQSDTVLLFPRDSVQLTAVTLDSLGRQLVARDVVWSITDTLVATVSASGKLVGVPYFGSATRSARAIASVEGKFDTTLVSVRPLAVSRLRSSPDTVTIGGGQSVQLSAVAEDALGSVLTGRAVNWTSVDTTIATVSGSGLVVGREDASGLVRVVRIIASAEGKADTTGVTVVPVPVGFVIVSPPSTIIAAGRRLTLQAEVRDSSASVLVGRAVTWSSRDTSVATVSSDGVVTVKTYPLVVNKTVKIVATASGVTGETTVNVTPAPVFGLQVTPATPTIAHRGSQQLGATVLDSTGLALEGRTVTWTSADTSIAVVAPLGLVEAKPFFGAGVRTVSIRAASESKFGTATISVNPATVSSVAIGPTPARLEAADTLQLISTPREVNGVPLLGRTTTWTSSDPGIASVTPQGVVKPTPYVGGLTRTVNVTATVEGISGTATITVLPASVRSVTLTPATSTILAGTTRQLTAALRDANNNALGGRTTAWSSSDTLIATVNSAGLVTSKPYFGAATRQVTITASSEGASATAMVTMTPLVTTSVTVAPARVTLLVGESVDVLATPLDAGNRVLTGRLATWTSSNASVATVSPAGTITAVALGTAVLTVTIDGLSASVPASVVSSAPTVAVVGVSPNATQLWSGRTLQLFATPADSVGGALAGRTVTWTSSNPGIATVNETGVVSGISLGFVNITATVDGKTGVQPLDVIAAPVSTITVTPKDPRVVIGRTLQLAATLKDSLGGTLTGRVLAWTSLNTAIATVNSSGLVTAVGIGSVQVRAQSEGKVAATTIRVVPPTLASLTVDQTSVSPRIGQTITVTPSLKDSAGVALGQVGRDVRWSSANDSVAVVSSTGVISGINVGATAVTLTIDSLSVQIDVLVRPRAPVSVAVTPSNRNLAIGQSAQLTATAFDNAGVAIARPTSWVTDDPAIATVTQSGLVTAIGEGVVTIRATADSTVGLTQVMVSDTLWKRVASLPFSGGIAHTVAYNRANGYLYAAKRPFDGVIYERRSSGQWSQITPPQGTMGSCVTLHFDEVREDVIAVGCGTGGVWRVNVAAGSVAFLGSGGAAGGNVQEDAERATVYSSIDQKVYAGGRFTLTGRFPGGVEFSADPVAEFSSAWSNSWAAGRFRAAAAFDQAGNRLFLAGASSYRTENLVPYVLSLVSYNMTTREVEALPGLDTKLFPANELAYCADRNALVNFEQDSRRLRTLRIGVDNAWVPLSTLRVPQDATASPAGTSTLICDPSRNRIWLVEAYADGNRILEYPLPPL